MSMWTCGTCNMVSNSKVCENMTEMQKLVQDKGYNWTFLYYSKNKELLKDYNIGLKVGQRVCSDFD